MLVDVTTLNGTVVFTTPSGGVDLSRVYGATPDPSNKRWIFPGYPPFGLITVSDLTKVDKSVQFTEAAKVAIEYLKKVPDYVAENQPQPESFITRPFDHQKQGVSYLYHHPRFALFYDAGCGKSKIIIDLLRICKGQKALILGPRITVGNWLQEVKIHGGSDLRAAAIAGTPKQKRAVIEAADAYDIVVTSYGTARTMGLPVTHKSAVKEILSSGKKVSEASAKALAKAVRVLSDPARQISYIEKWVRGASIPEVAHLAAEEASKRYQWIQDIPYQIIVADESHNLKDISSQQTKSVISLSKKAGRRYLMSGTPTLGDPRHLYPQMKFLAPHIIPEDWFGFSNTFLVRSPWNNRIVTGFKNLDILNKRVQRVAIRKKKEECLDLPPRQIIDVPFKLSSEQLKLYNTLVSAMGADLATFFKDTSANMLEVQNAATLLNKLAQVVSGFVLNSVKDAKICNGCPHLRDCVENSVHPYTEACKVRSKPPEDEPYFMAENPKMEALEELLDSILAEPTNKVIIWAVYKAEIDAIKRALEKRKVGHVVVDGRTGKDIQSLINRFNTEPDCRVYLSQVATGIGITLNAATYTLYYTLDWSLGTYEQSLDRNYRAGQTKKVTVYRLLGEGTIDRYKATALDEKKDISATLTNKIACATCVKQFECLRKKVELFDVGCLYRRSVSRTITKAEVIEDAPDLGKE